MHKAEPYATSFGLRMGEEADVEILGGVDQLLDRAAVALRVAEEELGDALLVGKLEERIGEVAALQTVHLAAHFPRQRQVPIETGTIVVVQGGLFHVSYEQCAVESAGVTLTAFEHGARVAPRREADRKSTRLNSSHLGISYAVFCL